MIKAIIIDDELPARELLEKLINRYCGNRVSVLSKCSNINDAYDAIDSHKPNLIFLDIKLGNSSGFDLLKRFENYDFEVIFTTAYSEYALEAIKQSALDYLLKPINQIDLLSAIKKYESKFLLKLEFDRIKLLLENISTNDETNKKIVLPTKEGYNLVKSNQVLFCVADSNYTKIILIDQTSYLISKTLKKVQELLPTSIFVRIHKSYLVNINYVKSYNAVDGSSNLILFNNKILPISSRKKSEILKIIFNK